MLIAIISMNLVDLTSVDGLVVLDLYRCALSMHLLRLTSVYVLVVLDLSQFTCCI